MVRQAFLNLNVKVLKIEVVETDGSTRTVLLEKPVNRPLIEDFRQQTKSIQLKHLEGPCSPLELFCGTHYKHLTNLAPFWRINTYDIKSNKNMRVRLGGFFTRNAQRGKDSRKDLSGWPCSLECSGLGIRDSVSHYSQQGVRSAGVRQWGDDNTLPN